MSKDNFHTNEPRKKWETILKLIRGIEINKLGPPEYEKRTEEEQKYVLSLVSDDEPFGGLCRILDLLTGVAVAVSADNKVVSADVMLPANVDALIENNISICKKDQQIIQNFYNNWLNKATDQNSEFYAFQKAGYVIITLFHIFIPYFKEKAFIKQQDELQGLINVFQKSSGENQNGSLVKKLQDIKTQHCQADELILATDLLIAETKENFPAINNRDNLNENIEKLSSLADKLVNAAERRKDRYPEERLIAAKIRLTINQQKIAPLPVQKFTEKLQPLLNQAQSKFKRHRYPLALRIIKDIYICLTLYNLAIEGLAYLMTGYSGLFNPRTRSLTTVHKLQKINSTFRQPTP